MNVTSRHEILLRFWMISIVVLAPAFCSADESVPGNVADAKANGSDELRARGAVIYKDSCADCHGLRGEGVESAYEAALVGDDSVGQLAKLISNTMPEGSPEDCVAEDAEAVAEFIHYAFYSEAAQIRNRPPRMAMSRLTGEQLRQSISDLYAVASGLPRTSEKHGARAEYFDGTRRSTENRKIERVDPVIDFDFGRESPGGDIKPEAFSIRWQGGILAEVTGRYEIVIRSSCSFVFDLGRDGRTFIDNHTQSGDKTEFRRTIALTGGRVYSFALNFTQRDRKTESPPAYISLSWVPPVGVEQVIPARNLIAEWVPAAYSLQANLPPDDRSYGYERGIAVSREWDESTTSAALEFSQIAFDELWPTYKRKHRNETDENRSLLRGFLQELVEIAFRQPLSDELREVYIDRQLAVEPDDAEAIKRVLLVSLKSPRFLYPSADVDASTGRRVANRLALVLFDSLATSDAVRNSSSEEQFASEAEVRNYAERYVNDYRVRAKTREFLYGWFNVEHTGEISKDSEQFPGFDRELVSDLRNSFDAFLDEVVWSEPSDFRQFFLAKSCFTTPRMAEFYGALFAPATEKVGLVPSVGSDEHFGILTHPYLLSSLAYHDATSPIHRGVFLIRYMLGRTLRPPSEAFTPLSPDLHPDLTTRERVDLQTSPESCQVCHSKINGLGFVLENYDAAGRFRELEKGKTINSTGVYTTRAGNEQHFAGARDLAVFLAESEDVHRAFVARAFQHFVKQPPAAFGAQTIDDLTAKFRESDFNIRKLIVEIAVVATKPLRQATDDQIVKD